MADKNDSDSANTMVKMLAYIVNNPNAGKQEIAEKMGMEEDKVDEMLSSVNDDYGVNISIQKKDYKPAAIAALAKNMDKTLTIDDIAKDSQTGSEIADTINTVCGATVVKSKEKAKIDEFLGNTNI